MSPEERLARIEVTTERILKILDGNGRRGLVADVAHIQSRLEAQDETLKAQDEILDEIKSQKNKSVVASGAAGGSLVTALTGLIAILMHRLGVSI